MSARIQSSSILAARMSNGAAQIPLFKVFMAPEAALLPRLREVLYSGQISEGPPVAEFAQRFGAFVGRPTKHPPAGAGAAPPCRDPDDLPRGRRLRWFGIDRAAPRTAIDVAEAG